MTHDIWDSGPTAIKERRELLLDHMRKIREVNPSVLRLETWYSTDMSDAGGKEELIDAIEHGDEPDCGTTACVVGSLAALFPEQVVWQSGFVYMLTNQGGAEEIGYDTFGRLMGIHHDASVDIICSECYPSYNAGVDLVNKVIDRMERAFDREPVQ